jgi:hypothetical protein
LYNHVTLHVTHRRKSVTTMIIKSNKINPIPT